MLLLLFPSSTGTLREDLCSSGITTPPGPFRRFRACCEKECGSSCGVRGCKSTCCYDNLLASNKFCQEAKDVKCIIPPPMPINVSSGFKVGKDVLKRLGISSKQSPMFIGDCMLYVGWCKERRHQGIKHKYVHRPHLSISSSFSIRFIDHVFLLCI
jgi:hypothetical protein